MKRRQTWKSTWILVLVLSSAFILLAGCGKKGGKAEKPKCSELFDKMKECGKSGPCGLGLSTKKDKWLKSRCPGSQDPDQKVNSWLLVQKRCLARDCKQFCPCLTDTLRGNMGGNNAKDIKVWDETK
ncbi:hypothetical protein KKF84_13315 [Myxococcota bacterium]|nr:hypothetical protein [Myxococcota bacterium]MBU1536298.1 hypothetical protein [Myxococcota bacterium]